MPVPPRTNRQIGRQRLPRSTAGLSLVELMIVVLIISLLFLAAVPAYQRIQRKARAAALANDFRVFGAVFQTYAHEKGSWPANSDPGVVPPGITDNDLQTNAWTKSTAMGGKFDWETDYLSVDGTGKKWHAVLTITDPQDGSPPPIKDANLMREIDEALDDGDLDTGNFRTGFDNCPILIIEP